MRTSSDVSLEAELKGGKYGVVRSLLRVLEGGTASKALLDTVIDACKSVTHPLSVSLPVAPPACLTAVACTTNLYLSFPAQFHMATAAVLHAQSAAAVALLFLRLRAGFLPTKVVLASAWLHESAC